MTVLEKVAFDENPSGSSEGATPCRSTQAYPARIFSRVRLKASPDLPGVSVSVNSQKTVIEL